MTFQSGSNKRAGKRRCRFRNQPAESVVVVRPNAARLAAGNARRIAKSKKTTTMKTSTSCSRVNLNDHKTGWQGGPCTVLLDTGFTLFNIVKYGRLRDFWQDIPQLFIEVVTRVLLPLRLTAPVASWRLRENSVLRGNSEAGTVQFLKKLRVDPPSPRLWRTGS